MRRIFDRRGQRIELLKAKKANWEQVTGAIRRVPLYGECTTITHEKLPTQVLKPICAIARTYRLERVGSLVAAYGAAALPLYVGVILSYPTGGSCLVAPPIIEMHGEDYVLIDGLHRLLAARCKGLSAVSVAVVRGELSPLPGDAVSWSCVRTVSCHTSRESKFRNFRPPHFRPISESLDSLGCIDNVILKHPLEEQEEAPNKSMESGK